MNFLNKNNLFLLEELVKKNFSGRYKDSYLGILWTVISPLLTMIILTIVFSTIFDKSIENYPVYLLAGRSVFRYFSGTCSSSMSVLRSNTNILLQKNVPKYIFILATLISEFIDYLISLGLLLLVMLVMGVFTLGSKSVNASVEPVRKEKIYLFKSEFLKIDMDATYKRVLSDSTGSKPVSSKTYKDGTKSICKAELSGSNNRTLKITAVADSGSADVYVVKRKGMKDLLLPAISSVIKHIDVMHKRIDVEVPRGLEEDEV